MLEAHIASGADMTCVCTSHPGESGDTYFKLDDTGRIVDTAYDIRTPEGYQSLNIFLLGRDLLLELVEDCMAHDRYSFRHNVLQDKGKELRFNGYVWDGFAARINSVQGYYQRSMELLRPEIRAELFCPQRPVYAKENDAASTYIDPSGECVNSLISDGCDIQGSIRNCILFRGVRVEKGAVVDGCILFKDTVVGRGAQLRHVISISYIYYMEIECFEFLIDRVWGAYVLNFTIDLKTIVINDHYKIVQFSEACKHSSFPNLTFLNLAIAQNGIDTIVCTGQFCCLCHTVFS